jgi:ribonuclease-3
MDQERLAQLEARLGVRFKDSAHFVRALTHRSAAAENALESNERMEFLGDSVVGLVISEYLFEKFPDYSEGNLAKSKAYIVSETALADAAQNMGLDEFVEMSSGEAAAGGRRRRSIQADSYEDLIAAVYLDRGIRSARRIVRAALKEAIAMTVVDEHRRDYKSALQERTQGEFRLTPYYRIIREEGMEHDKTFQAQAIVGEEVIGEGGGKSKKEAEQAAALDALERYAIADA